MSDDVIYIPAVGKLVAVSGTVDQPAMCELKNGTSVGDLIELAGGLSTVAAGQKARIERIIERRERRVDEVGLNTAGLAKPLQDGDLLEIYALSPRFENGVPARAVANLGRFPWREGMRVRDVIPAQDSLVVPEYWQRLNRSAAVGKPAASEPQRPGRPSSDASRTDTPADLPRNPSNEWK